MKQKDSEDSAKAKTVGVFKIFRYASGLDVLLMLVGSLCAFLGGAAFPIAMAVFGEITQLFINHQVSRDAANLGFFFCPSNGLPISVPVFNITGGTVDCAANYTTIDCTFTLPELLPGGINCLNNSELISEIDILVYAFIAIAVAAFLVCWLHVWFFQTTAERQRHKIRLLYYRAILKQDIGWFELEGHSSGELSARLSSDLDKIYDGIGDNLSVLVQRSSSFVGALIVGLYTRWELALLLCGIVPFMALAGALISRVSAIFASREQKLYSKAGGIATEVLSAVRTVFVFGGQQRESERYDRNLAAASKQGVFKGATLGFSVGIIHFLIFLVYSVSFWFGGFLVAEGRGDAGEVVTVFFAILVGAFDLGQTGPNLLAFSEARGAAGEIYETIDRPLTIDSSSEDGLKPNSFEPTVQFKNANFSYATRPDVQVLNDLQLYADVGQTVAIVGSSGSGKSTVIDLIQRFYELGSGQVLIGGHDIRELNVKWLRSKMGLVSQEPVLFDTTIAENIRLGKEDATLDEIQEAAKQANAHDFISSLPDGYDTHVGEGGGQLSGGQKQRVAIARALLRDPKVLLLDEATSALDSESERIVQEALDKAREGRTCIVIAHRLSTIYNSDVIAVLKKGKVVEQGTHQELMDKRGLYFKLNNVKTKVGQRSEDRQKEEGPVTTIEIEDIPK